MVQVQSPLLQPLKNGLQMPYMLLWCFTKNDHINVTPCKGQAIEDLVHPGASQGSGIQQRYPVRPTGYCYNCGSPDHYATSCPFPRQGQGAPRILPCQNCQEYGHTAPQCQKPMQARPVFKQVDPPHREQTGLNYAHTAGTENPGK